MDHITVYCEQIAHKHRIAFVHGKPRWNYPTSDGFYFDDYDEDVIGKTATYHWRYAGMAFPRDVIVYISSLHHDAPFDYLTITRSEANSINSVQWRRIKINLGDRS